MSAILNITLKGLTDQVTFRGDGVGDFQLLTPIHGFGLPSQRVSAFKYQGRDGEFVSHQFFTSRTINFTGRVKGLTQADLDDHVGEVYQKAVARNGQTITSTVEIELRDGTLYQIECNIRAISTSIDRRKNRRLIKFILQATDPNLYVGSTDQLETIQKLAGTPGYTFPYILPTTWGTGATGQKAINIQGEGIIYPTILISGTGSNPIISNLTSTQNLGFNLALADETLTIDMTNHTAKIGDVSQINNLDFNNNNQWWALLPGINEIQLGSSGAADSLQALVRFRHAKLGA